MGKSKNQFPMMTGSTLYGKYELTKVFLKAWAGHICRIPAPGTNQKILSSIILAQDQQNFDGTLDLTSACSYKRRWPFTVWPLPSFTVTHPRTYFLFPHLLCRTFLFRILIFFSLFLPFMNIKPLCFPVVQFFEQDKHLEGSPGHTSTHEQFHYIIHSST